MSDSRPNLLGGTAREPRSTTTPTSFPAGWPGRSRRINTALAALAERAINERWHLNAEGSARYDIERERIMRENT